ncbi:3-oxoacyl-[acyl-carrier-protein] synthase III C-terminal domain-containing protein [Amycolatopsis sp. DG1A-15b]|uniref:3-oxoacyl-[acyl-carrier-protein] synthase III C-terminal domain-containing protein n=1 Tax=Amycolatopsis sp. DG1A-15b TaxID=3052846 RepID=UPI00255B8F25|nr:3-oxoacyl-[acyl-carrier-protein] synthase III C-terminal domain-containing protein [Amycolatopsis sp. DG1A-15b]WIX90609.1 3-oxoacyl-[acyl-carrier-protein] synthase III C-terminal domain-containing protein [Amycolatopsis sp. DG1A-15b]
MTSLVAVSTYVPTTVAIESLQDELALSAGQVRRFRRMYGLDQVCRSDESEADMILGAVSKLDPLRGREERVRYVVRAKTMPAANPYPVDPMVDVREALGLTHATLFTLTDHACASGLLAVDLCGTLLAADGDPDALALILTGEKAFTHSAQVIPDTAIMGEATAAVLVGPGEDQDTLIGYATTTLGGPGGEVILDDDQAAEFRQIYPGTVADVALEAIAAAGLTVDDIDLVLPHNVNKISWVRASAALGIPRSKIFLQNVGTTGHCFCADPFLNYHAANGLGLLAPGARYLMISVGLGSTFSAMVFRK